MSDPQRDCVVDQSTPTKMKRLALKKWINFVAGKDEGCEMGICPEAEGEAAGKCQASLEPQSLLGARKRLFALRGHVRARIGRLKGGAVSGSEVVDGGDGGECERKMEEVRDGGSEVGEFGGETVELDDSKLSCYEAFHTFPKDLDLLFEYSMKRLFSGAIDSNLGESEGDGEVAENPVNSWVQGYVDFNEDVGSSEVVAEQADVQHWTDFSGDTTDDSPSEESVIGENLSGQVKVTSTEVGSQFSDGAASENSIMCTPPMYLSTKLPNEFNGFGSCGSLALLNMRKSQNYSTEEFDSKSSTEVNDKTGSSTKSNSHEPITEANIQTLALDGENLIDTSIIDNFIDKQIDPSEMEVRTIEDKPYLVVANASSRCQYDYTTNSLSIRVSEDQILLDLNSDAQNSTKTNDFSTVIVRDVKTKNYKNKRERARLFNSERLRECQMNYYYSKKYMPEMLSCIKDTTIEEDKADTFSRKTQVTKYQPNDSCKNYKFVTFFYTDDTPLLV